MAGLTGMERLPHELLGSIMEFISDKDLSICCTVCAAWHQVFSDDMFWRKRVNMKLSAYLKRASCIVKPYFVIPHVQNSSLLPVSGWRLSFLREQHYLKNLRSGRYEKKEIEFDCDDSISYNIDVGFVQNDYVFLYTTFEAQVWDVAQDTNQVMVIPYLLVELWEKNLYTVKGNKMIIVQCNVVQVFKICFLRMTWSFEHAFFFDKPEEFSSNITKETDVNEMFKNTSYEVGENLERLFCGNFFVGIVATERSMQNPVMHIWDLTSGKKIKEEKCAKHFGSDINNITLKNSSSSSTEIIVACQKSQHKCIAVYSLAELKFRPSYQCRTEDVIICGRYVTSYDYIRNEIYLYNLDTNARESMCKFNQGRVTCWNVIEDQIVVVNSSDLYLINPRGREINLQSHGEFQLATFKIVKDKYLALHDREKNMRELLELRVGDRRTKSRLVLLFSLPPNSGTYRAEDELCTKMLLERANKLIILFFW